MLAVFSKAPLTQQKSAHSKDPRGDIQWLTAARVMNMTDMPTLNVNKQQNGRGKLE